MESATFQMMTVPCASADARKMWQSSVLRSCRDCEGRLREEEEKRRRKSGSTALKE